MPLFVQVKSVLNKTKKRDAWFLDDYTINPYSGCSFNCLYCYIRGSKYGLHMEEKLTVKENALEVLEKQLHSRAKKNQYGIIVLSSATEPYLHFEKELKLTRGILELVLKYKFPVHIITKSDLVTRDFDLLHQINEVAILPDDLIQLKHKAIISFSFSTIDDELGKIFEPGAAPPSIRLETLRAASQAGFFTGVSMMPLLPDITDTDEALAKMFIAFKKAGAHYIMPASLTLFGNEPTDSKTLMLRAIQTHFPEKLKLYEGLFQRYTSDFFYQKMVNQRFKNQTHLHGIPDRII